MDGDHEEEGRLPWAASGSGGDPGERAARQGPRTRWKSFLPGGEGCPPCVTFALLQKALNCFLFFLNFFFFSF